MFFLYGNEDFLIQQEIKRIAKKFSDYQIVNVNENSDFISFLSNIENNNLFSSKELIIVKIDNLLLKEKEEKLNLIIDFLNKNNHNDKKFIFIEKTEENINKNKKNLLRNYLLKNAQTQEFLSIKNNEIYKYIMKIVKSKNGFISEIDAIKLSTLLPNDLYFITKEIDKLISYNPTINLSTIDALVMNNFQENDFAFIDAISEMNFERILFLYKKNVSMGQSINVLISQIFSFFNDCFIVDSLLKEKKNDLEISKEYSLHIFRIKKAHIFIKKVGISSIKKWIEELANIDYEIKAGILDEKNAFEAFLYKFLKWKG
ncbi:DNA polymerase III subunit delta [Mesomycoplasma lagogenitalium]|uniref:DNA polymerase III subunit delta n=1 Tax=Mesomycoplasma lagogenitalium TaxID=171286 RepID=A0ABY8LST2_9BACT|nr:hypothetical protein [Mesomycoplasma lagogenitalium]WGI36314.1 hypothetical protein QEG99_02440 [Mesomycoplasma lagogenitalium]